MAKKQTASKIDKTPKSEAAQEVEKRLKSLSNHNFEIVESKSGEIVYLSSPWEDRSIALIASKGGLINE